MQQFDLLGIGNSVVDLLYKVDDEFIKNNKLEKGVMTLIDEEKAEKFYSKLKQGVEVAGGSVANSTVGFASLSGKPAFIGKIKDDNLGKSFSKSLDNNKVFYKTKPSLEGPGTARCFIFVTPDAQRTMNTYIGACSLLSPKDIDEETLEIAMNYGAAVASVTVEGFGTEKIMAITKAEIEARFGKLVGGPGRI